MDAKLVRQFAEVITGEKGDDALQQFSKQLVLGASRTRGNEVLTEVFQEELLAVNGLKVLTKMTFEIAGRFRWSFSENWLNDLGAWEKRDCAGIALVGMQEDARFFFLTKDDAFSSIDDSEDGTFVLNIPIDHALLRNWEAQFSSLKRG